MRSRKLLQRSLRYLWREWIKPLAVIAGIILPFKSAIADWNWVPTGSMKPTILEGDLVLVNKLAYDLKVPFTLWRLAAWGDPVPGDVVVLFSPHDGQRLVKRMIAGPGDTVELRNNTLFLNGQPLTYDRLDPQPFARETYEDPNPIIAHEHGPNQPHLVMSLPSRRALRDFPAMTVPDGKYFVMGDSRDNSFDSRYFGFVDRSAIVGRSQRVLLSFDKHHHYVPRFSRSFARLDP